MFELKLHAGVAALLRKALATISTVADTILVDIQSDRVVMSSPSRQRPGYACALLWIPTPPSDVALITCDAPVAFVLSLADLIQRLIPAGDESDDVILTFQGRDGKFAQVSVGFRFAKPESGTFAVSHMPVLSDETHRRMHLPTSAHKYETIIEIPSEDFVRLIRKLQHLAEDVSVTATRTEVKFSAKNEEVILRTQLGANPETVECTIEGIQDADTVSFSFSLRFRKTIINTCKLSGSVQLFYSPGLTPVLNCALGRLGNMMLFL